MQKEIKTQILINRTPQQVWRILTDFGKYGDWNPFVKSITGEVKESHKIKVVLGPKGSKPMTFRPKVLVFNEGKQFKWLGHMIIPGIFDGEHNFELMDNGDGSTTFFHSEKFKGLLVGPMAKKLDNEIMDGFIAMNKALKVRSEGQFESAVN
jgi:hypothetical protein